MPHNYVSRETFSISLFHQSNILYFGAQARQKKEKQIERAGEENDQQWQSIGEMADELAFQRNPPLFI